MFKSLSAKRGGESVYPKRGGVFRSKPVSEVLSNTLRGDSVYPKRGGVFRSKPVSDVLSNTLETTKSRLDSKTHSPLTCWTLTWPDIIQVTLMQPISLKQAWKNV